jgi:DNA helicase-2/ATP-dependent DNA helicase PcrA
MLPELSKGTLNKLTAFRMMIEGFSEQLSTADAAHLGEQIIKQSGISQDLYSSTDPEYLSKQEHLEEFLASMEEFVETQREQDAPEGLVDFLHEVSLLSDRETEDTDKPQVTLMTVHSAKGLEFPCVYIVAMEEDIFPSAMSSGNIHGIEEERRLLYVAITRAERYCHLTYAKIRFRYGKQEWCTPSRFLKEIDTKLLKFNNVQSLGQTQSYNRQGLFKTKNTTYQSQPRNNFTRIEKTIPATSTSKQNTQNPTEILKIGDAVAHNRFGQGVIVKLEGSGPSCKATVDFINAGQKTLMLKFANLHKIST